MLEAYRSVDHTDERGNLAASMLAGLGADVVLDLTDGAGRTALGALCRDADVVIESGAVALDLAALRAEHPELVTVSISAFGPTGPKAQWPATDLTAHAAGCQLTVTGHEDRAPVRTTVPQAFLHASADAAVGALMALLGYDDDRVGALYAAGALN